MLKFKAKPDYEMPGDANTDNVYEVTVRAADAIGNTGMMAVKVSVTNVEEAGNGDPVEDPAAGWSAVTASLTDPDGSISGLAPGSGISVAPASTEPTDNDAIARRHVGHLHSTGTPNQTPAPTMGYPGYAGETLTASGELHRRAERRTQQDRVGMAVE